MSTQELDSRTSSGPTPIPPPSSSTQSHHPYPGTPPSSTPDASTAAAPNVIIDIGDFVTKYNEMMNFLYPLELVVTTVLYIIRWENYFLTLVTLLFLCILFYYPALLASFLVASAIVGMAVGKYYSQTKLNTLLRRRETPQVNYLDEDNQTLRKCKQDQKSAHKLLLEYGQIVCSAEALISLTTKTLEYVYKIILWKSLEVSLCVTVLLCVLFTLICTVYLRVLSACLPLIVLCFNRHFIKRTVELWRLLLSYFYGKVRLKRNKTPKVNQPVGVVAGRGSAEVVHHSEDPPLTRDDGTDKAVPGEDAGLSVSRQPSPEARGGVHGGVGGVNGTDVTTKGVCYKCNASFAKLLKRKHDCNYCGQTFCGSCTVKVKRAVLGATSPAAFEESVRVCLDCKNKLDGLKLGQNSIPAS